VYSEIFPESFSPLVWILQVEDFFYSFNTRNIPESPERIHKNLFCLSGFHSGLFFLIFSMLLLTMVIPYGLLIFFPGPVIAGTVALNLLIRILLVLAYRHPPFVSIVLHPISILYTARIALHSWNSYRKGSIIWKGRAIKKRGKHTMMKQFFQTYGLIILIYVVMILGGIWHLAGLFHKTSQILYVPLLVLLFSINLIYFISLYRETPLLNIFFFWTGLIFLTAMTLEIVGEKTGVLFGHYAYTDVLSPQIFGVPLVIGFSWLNLVFGAVQIANLYLSRYPWVFRALFASLLMTGFDGVMEPAARALGFWYWQNYTVPWQNYVAWFALGFIFCFPFLRYFPHAKDRQLIPMHIFLAQFLYFVLVNLA